MARDTRPKRDLHALNDDGMVVCNPRDKEAAHRAEVEGIATDDRDAVTCPKCLLLLYNSGRNLGKPRLSKGRPNSKRRGPNHD